MAPTALDPKVQNGHHDSFTLPTSAQQQQPPQQQEGKAKVHASARYTPDGGAFTVQAEGTRYGEEGVKAKYVDRGSAVTREYICRVFQGAEAEADQIGLEGRSCGLM